MPRLELDKKSLDAPEVVPGGTYQFRCDGFEPRLTKDKTSINARPLMVIVNHPDQNGNRLFSNMNQKASFIVKAFCHALGVDVDYSTDGTPILPGEFDGPDGDVTKWRYRGPLLGRIGSAVTAVEDDINGKPRNVVKQFVCILSGCKDRHPTELS